MVRIPKSKKYLAVRVALVCATTFFFRVVLDFLYVKYVIRFYASDFPLSAPSMPRLLESYAVVLILGIWIANSLYRRWRPSGIALVLYFVVVMIPLSSQYGLADAPVTLIYAATGSMALLVIITELHPKIKLPKPGRGIAYIAVIGLFGICAYVYGWLLFSGGLERLDWDLRAVYKVRAEYIQRLGPFMGYFIPWQGYVINVYGLLSALRRRSYLLLCLFAVAQLLLFGMTGHKSFLLAPFLVGGVYWVWQRKNAISLIIIGASMLMLTSYGYFLITGDEFLPSLFVRRLFFVPARLHVLYYDFFSQPEHSFYMLSDSILSSIIKNPYGMPMPRVIALAYWGREFWPDVGYLGDAYGNFGLLGMFLFSALLGVVLRIVDSVGSRLPSHFVAAAIAMPAMALTESALFTSMLTHGLIPAVVILWIIGALSAYRVAGSRDGREVGRCF